MKWDSLRATHVGVSLRQPWLRVALLLGAVYLLIGTVFPVPANHVRVWRLAAWVVSGVAFAVHIGYERFRLRSSPRSVALHTALAVAIGAFMLAVAGALHSLRATSAIRPVWLLAFVAWPLITAVPAFLVALAAGALLARIQQRADGT